MQDVVLFLIVVCLTFTAASPGSSLFVEQWVANVTAFSSELGISPAAYSASQVIGPPDVYPQSGTPVGEWYPDMVDWNPCLDFLEKFRFKTSHIRIEVTCRNCIAYPAIDAVKLVGLRELPSSTPLHVTSSMTVTAYNVTPSATRSTHNAAASNVTYVTPSTRNGQACFQCAYVSHLELCDNIETCPENEICYLERYINTAGHTHYRSGCKDAMTCNVQRANADPVTECVTCCSGHLCNSAGCGDSGFPPRGARGPVCYDCPYVRSVSECHMVSVCQPGQVCSIEEYPLGDHSHFKLGCVHETCHYLKRATPRCHNCCNHDYCNANCTRPDIPFDGSFVG